MGGVKTAISLDEELIREVDSMAQELKISRSRLFVIAVRDFLKKRENRGLLERLNAAYADPQDEEHEVSGKMKAKRSKLVRKDPW